MVQVAPRTSVYNDCRLANLNFAIQSHFSEYLHSRTRILSAMYERNFFRPRFNDERSLFRHLIYENNRHYRIMIGSCPISAEVPALVA